MNIINWNCGGAFRKKIHLIEKLQPDIAVISESESPEKITLTDYWNPNPLWVGENPHKGLGVFVRQGMQLEFSEPYNPEFKYVLPATVSGNTTIFLLALWAHPTIYLTYIGSVHFGIEYYRNRMNSHTLIVGDFNHNVIWDDEEVLALEKLLVDLGPTIFKVSIIIISRKN